MQLKSIMVGLGALLLCPLVAAMVPAISSTARADIRVIASIKPVHSLVAAVMEGVGEPGLIVGGAGSPHTDSLKPSQAVELGAAELIFWIGPQLEGFLEKPIATIGAKAVSIELFGAARETAETGTVGDGHHQFDAHVWLDPHNAKSFVRKIQRSLTQADPDNTAIYEQNAGVMVKKLSSLMNEIQAILAPVKGESFIVYHEAYQAFEKRFGLNVAGSLTTNPDVGSGARRIGEAQVRIREAGVVCVFTEPQFDLKLVPVVVEGSNARIGVLDPLGAGLENGPDLYFSLIRNMARSIADCLAGPD